jgi:glycosyltransferase involved in cell wall biosynthesis
MHTGKPLVVDNRGGWQYMIDHNKTGFLCNNERDFIYYGSILAYEPELRTEIAHNAYQKAQEISGLEVSVASWRKVFERIFN